MSLPKPAQEKPRRYTAKEVHDLLEWAKEHASAEYSHAIELIQSESVSGFLALRRSRQEENS
jgi:hypothetical protein